VRAILIAMFTSSLVFFTTRPEPATGAEAVARTVAEHLADDWDDPDGLRLYLRHVREVTGLDARLVREPQRLPAQVRRIAARGALIVPADPQHVVIPVFRAGTLVGGLEIERFGPRPTPWAWWRFALTLFLVVAVLSAMAGILAEQLARPLEELAKSADRLGAGDLSVRTEGAGEGRRWVAREVGDVAISFNRMAARIEATVRGQRELLGAISHELRSPLGRARVALEIVRDRLPPGLEPRSPSAALDDVEVQLHAIDSILEDLLDVTRAGLADLRRQRRPLAEWVRERLAEEPSAPLIELAVAPDASDLTFSFDPALMSRVVHNLLVNARAHGHPVDQPIEVHIERASEWARVVVRDRGPGFPAGFVDRAFEPFVRGSASRARPSVGAGYGLGLAIVRRIVEAHGGRTFARNVEGGAEVGFDLPIDRAPR
jgi:signal transduction histidine kinase